MIAGEQCEFDLIFLAGIEEGDDFTGGGGPMIRVMDFGDIAVEDEPVHALPEGAEGGGGTGAGVCAAEVKI